MSGKNKRGVPYYMAQVNLFDGVLVGNFKVVATNPDDAAAKAVAEAVKESGVTEHELRVTRLEKRWTGEATV